MKYIIMDTEASSLQTAIAEMYSFGGFSVETDSNGLLDFNTIMGIHRFFNTDKEVPAEAGAVNKLTRKILEERSNGDYLEDCYQELDYYMYRPDAYLVGYNTQFDKSIITSNYLRHGLNRPQWKGVIDVMQEQKILLRGTGYDKPRGIKLVKAKDIIFRQKLHISDDKLKEIFSLFVSKCGIEYSDTLFHTALWDAFITMMIFRYTLIAKKEG